MGHSAERLLVAKPGRVPGESYLLTISSHLSPPSGDPVDPLQVHSPELLPHRTFVLSRPAVCGSKDRQLNKGIASKATASPQTGVECAGKAASCSRPRAVSLLVCSSPSSDFWKWPNRPDLNSISFAAAQLPGVMPLAPSWAPILKPGDSNNPIFRDCLEVKMQ